jgi:ABC-type amino acid transport substrate-binding protein
MLVCCIKRCLLYLNFSDCLRSLLLVLSLPVLTFNSIALETVEIGLLDSYPWSYQADSGEIKGIYPELLRQVEGDLKGSVKIEIRIVPMARILSEIGSSSDMDMTIMSFRPERAELMLPKVRIYRTPFVLLSHNDFPVRNLNDLQDKSVAMLWGGSGCPCLDSSITYQKTKVSSHLQGLKMLQDKRVDAVAGPAIRLLGQVSNIGMQDIVALPTIYEWREVWLWSSKEADSNQSAVERLKVEFDKFIKSGALKLVAQKYLSTAQLEFVIPLP